jgi:hypothetical protein
MTGREKDPEPETNRVAKPEKVAEEFPEHLQNGFFNY